MYLVTNYRDSEELKFKVASDPNVISKLALFAHMLGFGWCGGTRSNLVGNDFEVRKSGDEYLLKGHYDSKDPYADGYWADKRLHIALRNFRITFDPRSFVYGTPQIASLKPLMVSSYLARNDGDEEDTATKTFTYQLTEAVAHTTNFSFTEGFKVAVKWKAEIPFFGGGEASTEFSFGATQGWSDSSTTTEGETDTSTYTGKLPPHTQRLIRLIASRVSSDITYTATARIGFDVEFYNFLRYSGNARADHPQDRPFVTLKFGTDYRDGLDDIADKWKHRGIPGYWDWVDWDWMTQNFGTSVDSTMSFIDAGIGAPTSGKFNDVKGTSVYTSGDDAEPVRQMADMTVRDGVQLLTMAAARGELREQMPPNDQVVPDEFLLQTDEDLGAKVIGIR